MGLWVLNTKYHQCSKHSTLFPNVNQAGTNHSNSDEKKSMKGATKKKKLQIICPTCAYQSSKLQVSLQI